jgi:hypothetical protein
MKQRNINLKDVLEIVSKGNISTGRVVEDFIGGAFFTTKGVVIVYAPYNDFDAMPVIVTVFSREEPIDYDEYLVEFEVAGKKEAVAPSPMVQAFISASLTPKVIGVDDLSDEELEQILATRRQKKKEAKEKRVTELNVRKEELMKELTLIDSELHTLQL